ncbi:copper resistance protein NlpE N-terminal domain-containing protein [Larsenimonas rhizosphaerae]|uniref:Copper resistance protein NlpE N-terminal domain-containing protein n=1 Tax=Larsenimonas rhizosphaerae TaxID=2944682 RepID=A0AA41ZIH4_9GAMM|nr:copper resistance protein NlpE N-terminal domain-containing protein [Larsenimonas rhizosphaerae]MCM2131415.1 copper resistance protein NlpE [Larsenimonas rhizosphaerae]MCX2525220.1 copper resistance protein NlpE N-terminal domain-containing protein [Larsenimonas rhizosphaerae]
MQIRTLLAGVAMTAALAGCATSGSQAPDSQKPAAQTAEYKGTLPCRNCDGIDLTVDLTGTDQAQPADRTFTLEAEYVNHPQNPPAEHYEGNWDVMTGTPADDKATVYELTPNGEGQVYYFQRIDPQTLELIDPQLRRFENGQALQLKKQP